MEAKSPVEAKVKASAVGGGVTGAVVVLVMYLLNAIPAVSAMPDGAAGALLVVVTAVVTYVGSFVVGYLAKHTDRPNG